MTTRAEAIDVAAKVLATRYHSVDELEERIRARREQDYEEVVEAKTVVDDGT